MQLEFDFGAVEDMRWLRDRLGLHFGRPDPIHLRAPINQLVKSSISNRTRDEVSLEAYRRLVHTYRDWADLASAPRKEIEAAINDVTFPDFKAKNLGAALRSIAASRPDFDLSFLAGLGVPGALAWLERLPGVARKVAASTLSFSTLRMPAFVVDTHVLRILSRFGFVGRKADIPTAYDTVMGMSESWTATDLAELHVLMKRLGQTICRADGAFCRDCPIRQRCRAAGAR